MQCKSVVKVSTGALEQDDGKVENRILTIAINILMSPTAATAVNKTSILWANVGNAINLSK